MNKCEIVITGKDTQDVSSEIQNVLKTSEDPTNDNMRISCVCHFVLWSTTSNAILAFIHKPIWVLFHYSFLGISFLSKLGAICPSVSDLCCQIR